MGLQQCRLDSGVQPCNCVAQHLALLEGHQSSSQTFSPLKIPEMLQLGAGARANSCCLQPRGEPSTMRLCGFGSPVLEKQRAVAADAAQEGTTEGSAML